MPYIGQQPTSVAFLTDTFSGNGSTTAFTLSAAPANTSSVLVAVSGVLQDPSTYAVTGTTLNFSAAPPSGTGNISVRFLGIPASGVTTTAYRTVTEFTATAGQTTFSVPSYTVGFIDVYRNGVMLGSADYTATNGTTVVLATGATAGDLVEVISFQVSSVLNAIPNSPASVGTSNIANGVTINFADGSASTPSITNDGDTNTGMFFPAADSIGFAEGGAEIARFNSAGRLGIGTTDITAKITVSGNGVDSAIDFNNTEPSTGRKYRWVSRTDGNFSVEDLTAVGTPQRIAISSTGNFAFNSGYGSAATAYGCRAWVCFNGTTGPIAIIGSGGISSIGDNGVGNYTVNFSTSMVDANYACVMGQQRAGTSDFINEGFNRGVNSTNVECFANTSMADFPKVQLAFFR